MYFVFPNWKLNRLCVCYLWYKHLLLTNTIYIIIFFNIYKRILCTQLNTHFEQFCQKPTLSFWFRENISFRGKKWGYWCWKVHTMTGKVLFCVPLTLANFSLFPFMVKRGNYSLRNQGYACLLLCWMELDYFNILVNL